MEQQQEKIYRNRKKDQLKMFIERRDKIYRKRKQDQLGIDGNIKCSSVCGIDELPDDVLVNILSRISVKEAARASVLSRRWRYLGRFSDRILRFDNRNTTTGKVMGRNKFMSWVNTALELHQSRRIECIVINFEAKKYSNRISHSTSFDNWVYFAMQKEVQSFELYLSCDDHYEFPSVEELISHSHEINSPLCHLRILKLAYVDIEDEVVHHFVASCPNLEELSVHFSHLTKNLKVMDPPRLRVLEISRCSNIQSLVVSTVHLVSLTYRGQNNILALVKVPNVRELTLCDYFCLQFVNNPRAHRIDYAKLEKLVLDLRLTDVENRVVPGPGSHQFLSLKRLEVQVFSVASKGHILLTTLIKASPQLREFRIEMSYASPNWLNERILFYYKKEMTEAMNYVHTNLEVVEIGGYVGCLGEKELVLALIKIGPSIERVVIDTETDYFGLDYYISSGRGVGLNYSNWRPQTKTTRDKAKESAKRFASKFPEQIKYTTVR